MSGRKVLLLYPPISRMERYSSAIGSAGGQQIPLGVLYLASSLTEAGYLVEVIDAEVEGLSAPEILERVREYGPDYIGISSTTVAFHRALEAAELFKQDRGETPIIVGGPHVSADVRGAMSNEAFDYAVVGEGEETIVELLDSLAEGRPPQSVAGIAFRDERGDLVVNPPREYIGDIDSIPFPAYDLIRDIASYVPPPSNYRTLPVINMITSRGCPSHCTFCDRSVFGQKYRQRSAESTVAEIKYLREKHGVREIAFVDDCFMLSKKRIHQIFDLLDSEGIQVNWTCMSRVGNIDYEFLEYIKSRGCWHISFGIESGDAAILETIRKNISLEQVEKVISWCSELGIRTKGFFILGHPHETVQTLDMTIDLACRLKLDDLVATINTPIKGSDQYREIDKYGSLDETDLSRFNYWEPVFVPSGLTSEILMAKHREMYRRFYLRPRVLARYFLSFFSRGGSRRFYSVLRASLYVLKPGSRKRDIADSEAC
jgi:anaerobic magnesium-protoporphyrin IX monomethyl ester cyclase